MATKTKKSKVKKSTQTYTCVELFNGDAYHSGYNNLSLNYQERTPVRVAILQGQYSSTFVVNRKREGTSKNGIPWSKWEVWGQVIVSTRALNKAGIKKLNVYGKYRMKEGGPKSWFPFRNITSYPDMVRTIVAAPYLMHLNKEIARLMTENIAPPTLNLDDYKMITRETHPDLTHRERNELIAFSKLNLPYLYPMHTAYPVTKTMKGEIDRIPSGMTKHLRYESMMDVTRSMYGSKLYRKDLVKAVSEAPLELATVALTFKGILPIDWIIKLLNDHHGALARGLTPVEVPIMKSLFKALTVHQQKRFLIGLTREKPKETASHMIVADTLRMFKLLNERYNANYAPGQLTAKSWSELHDDLGRDLSRRGIRDEPIEKVKLAEKIDGVSLPEGYSLILPRSTHELIDWGRKMEHCIGSYTFEAVKGSSVFLGIVKDKTMIGNAQISVREKRLVQVFGKRNRYLDKETLEVFSKGLIENDVLAKNGFNRAFGYNLTNQ
jgi:hypothetical protein